MAEQVEREVFAARVGSALEVRALDPQGDEAVGLQVEEIQDFGAGDGTRFSVFFTGPGEQYLPQGIYHVHPGDGEAFELFLVPVGLEDDRYRYEAAFNRDG